MFIHSLYNTKNVIPYIKNSKKIKRSCKSYSNFVLGSNQHFFTFTNHLTLGPRRPQNTFQKSVLKGVIDHIMDSIEQKGMTFDHDFGYLFEFFSSLLKKRKEEKENNAKIVIKSHAFPLDQCIRSKSTYFNFLGAAINLMTYSKVNQPTNTASAISKKLSSSKQIV